MDGVSANSPEAIELNLARATKSGGLKKVGQHFSFIASYRIHNRFSGMVI